MRSPTQSLGFQQTSSGWNDGSLARCICFLRIAGDRKVGVEGWEGDWWWRGRRRGGGLAIDMPHAVPTPD